eukprot:PhM_4_TR5374/c0_g1_i1/m.90673
MVRSNNNNRIQPIEPSSSGEALTAANKRNNNNNNNNNNRNRNPNKYNKKNIDVEDIVVLENDKDCDENVVDNTPPPPPPPAPPRRLRLRTFVPLILAVLVAFFALGVCAVTYVVVYDAMHGVYHENLLNEGALRHYIISQHVSDLPALAKVLIENQHHQHNLFVQNDTEMLLRSALLMDDVTGACIFANIVPRNASSSSSTSSLSFACLEGPGHQDIIVQVNHTSTIPSFSKMLSDASSLNSTNNDSLTYIFNSHHDDNLMLQYRKQFSNNYNNNTDDDDEVVVYTLFLWRNMTSKDILETPSTHHHQAGEESKNSKYAIGLFVGNNQDVALMSSEENNDNKAKSILDEALEKANENSRTDDGQTVVHHKINVKKKRYGLFYEYSAVVYNNTHLNLCLAIASSNTEFSAPVITAIAKIFALLIFSNGVIAILVVFLNISVLRVLQSFTTAMYNLATMNIDKPSSALLDSRDFDDRNTFDRRNEELEEQEQASARISKKKKNKQEGNPWFMKSSWWDEVGEAQDALEVVRLAMIEYRAYLPDAVLIEPDDDIFDVSFGIASPRTSPRGGVNTNNGTINNNNHLGVVVAQGGSGSSQNTSRNTSQRGNSNDGGRAEQYQLFAPASLLEEQQQQHQQQQHTSPSFGSPNQVNFNLPTATSLELSTGTEEDGGSNLNHSRGGGGGGDRAAGVHSPGPGSFRRQSSIARHASVNINISTKARSFIERKLSTAQSFMGSPILRKAQVNGGGLRGTLQTRRVTALSLHLSGMHQLADWHPAMAHEIASEVYSLVSRVSAETHGVITQSDGCTTLVTWNAFKAVHRHEATACDVALRLVELLTDFLESKEYSSEIVVGIFVTTAPMAVGYIGDATRRTITVLSSKTSECVTVLSRLNETLGTTVLMSAATRDVVGNTMFSRIVDYVATGDGTHQPIYELLLVPPVRPELYNEAVSSLRTAHNGKSATTMESYLATVGIDADPQALRVWRVARTLEDQEASLSSSARHAMYVRKYVGWEIFRDEFSDVYVPMGASFEDSTSLTETRGAPAVAETGGRTPEQPKFMVDDVQQPTTPHELVFDPPPPINTHAVATESASSSTTPAESTISPTRGPSRTTSAMQLRNRRHNSNIGRLDENAFLNTVHGSLFGIAGTPVGGPPPSSQQLMISPTDQDPSYASGFGGLCVSAGVTTPTPITEDLRGADELDEDDPENWGNTLTDELEELGAGANDGAVPAVITDEHTGERWVRSEILIGKGAQGQVWLGVGDDSKFVAMKFVRISKTEAGFAVVKSAAQETVLLSRLRHDNIVGYVYGSVVGSQWIVSIMEYASTGSLEYVADSFRSTLSEQFLQRCFREILRGLAFLHDNGVIHRDVKPANILMTGDGCCRLSDFGTSYRTKKRAQQAGGIRGMSVHADDLGLAGSPVFMSPEACRGGTDVTSATDIWSFGITAHKLLTGEFPYSSNITTFELISGLRRTAVMVTSTMSPDGEEPSKKKSERMIAPAGLMPTLSTERLSSEAIAFLRCCFQSDPAGRSTAEQLLAHPYLM